MLRLYKKSSCTSSRMAKSWLIQHQIPFEEIPIHASELTENDLLFLLKHSLNGTDDLISKRSKAYQVNQKTIESFSTKEWIAFVLANPSFLRSPIMVSGETILIGYHKDEIRCFIPKNERREEVQQHLYALETSTDTKHHKKNPSFLIQCPTTYDTTT